MAGLKGEAAIAGWVELPPQRKLAREPSFTIEQWARLSRQLLDDAGLTGSDVNGIVATGIAESDQFAPATLAEYLGIPINFGEVVDLGGATSAGMVWRAAAAVELGICDAVLAVVPDRRNIPRSVTRPAHEFAPFGASSNNFGSPQAEFEIPYGNLGQNIPYAQIAQRYAAEFGWDARALAKIAVDQRTNSCAWPDAVFYGNPITIEDVLDSPMIADPIHKLEIVMPCHGGAGVLIVNADLARKGKHRPVWLKGFGEHIAYKTPTYAEDLVRSPITKAAAQAFAMAGLTPGEMDMASIYDCYTITVLMSIEDSDFCEKGAGLDFVATRDLTYRGDFPINTVGGQLSFGQAGTAGGMHHVIDGARQIMGRAEGAQVADCNRAYVTGNGGIMSEQVALVLVGD